MLSRRQFLYGASIAGSTILPGRRDAEAQLVTKYAKQLKNGEFNWFPERSPGGPILIIVSIPDQLVHVYRNGIRIAASTCSTGKPGHRTPTGVFKILQKDRRHRSSTYSNAPMPNMNRLTWSGIALHAGNLPGYPASHGCVRLPMQFSDMLFGITKLGMTVIIADEKSQPASVTHPGLVLGDSARREFAGVEAAVKKQQYSEGHVAQTKATSIVVSGKDRSIVVLENHKVAARGKVKIADENKPLSNRAYQLQKTDSAGGSLEWSSAGYGKADRADLNAELRRINAEPAIHEEIRSRMQQGMTLVTTHESSTEAQRASDFVIIDGLW